MWDNTASKRSGNSRLKNRTVGVVPSRARPSKLCRPVYTLVSLLWQPSIFGPPRRSRAWSRRCSKDAMQARGPQGAGDICCAPPPIASLPRASPPRDTGPLGCTDATHSDLRPAEHLLGLLQLFLSLAQAPGHGEGIALHHDIHEWSVIRRVAELLAESSSSDYITDVELSRSRPVSQRSDRSACNLSKILAT
jgi:hypothetical protein